MSSIWEAEWERQRAEERRAIAENDARIRNLQRNLDMFRGNNPLPITTPRNPIPQIPNSTSFNPYTPYIPSIEPSTRIRDEVNEIIRRQRMEEARNYGPQTEGTFAEWNRRNNQSYDIDAFMRGRNEPVDRALAGDAANRERDRALYEARRQIAEYEARRNNIIQLPGQVDEYYISPMGRKEREFNRTDFGPDSTIARLRRQERSEAVPTWNTMGPQTLDDYVAWLKRQGRNQEAANIEWENRRNYQTQFGETPEQQQNRRRSTEAQNRIDVETGRAVNGPGFEMRRSPLQATQDAARAEFDRIAAENKRFWDSVDAQNARRNAERNGFNPLLSQSDRNALEAARRRFERDNDNIRIPDLSTDSNTSGLNRIPQNRTGGNNQVPTGNRFTRNNPIQGGERDFGGGTGTLTRNGNPNNPQGPRNPMGYLFDDSTEAQIRRQILQNTLPLIAGNGIGIRANYDRFNDESRVIDRPRNMSLPGTGEPVRRGFSGSNLMPATGDSVTQNRGRSFGSGITGGSNNNLNSSNLRRGNSLGGSPYGAGPGSMVMGDIGQTLSSGVLERAQARARLEAGGDLVWKKLPKGEQSRRLQEAHNEEMRNLFQPWKWRLPNSGGPIRHSDGSLYRQPGLYDGVGENYWEKEARLKNDRARRSVGSYYGTGIGGNLAQLGRQISADSNNAYRRLLREEQRKQQLQKDESRRTRKYWDDLDSGRLSAPNQQRRQYIDPETARELNRQQQEDRRRITDPFENARRRDLQNTEEWNRRNPDFYKDAEWRRREKEIEFWLNNDPSKIGNKYDPWKPAPIPDPANPPDPDYPPLPPGLMYPIWGWSIEAVSIVEGTGSLIYWYSEYIKNSDLEGDMPVPSVDSYDNGVTFINNEGGWQTGRTGIWVLPDGRFSNPPAYVGGDESEIFTEAKYIEKWGVLWSYPYNSPIWYETGNQNKQNEVFQDKRRLESRGKSNFINGTTTIVKTTPIRGKQPVPDTRPQNPPKPEPEEPIMPGCSYMPDKQNPAIVSWWDKLTGSIKKKPIQVHEGVDEGFEHVSLQIAQLNERIEGIAKVLDVDKYTAPQGKVVAPVLGMQAITTVLGSSNPLVPIPLVKTLPQENMIFAAVNHMFSGHHLLGKLQLPLDPNKGADDLGNMQRLTPLTVMGYMHKMYNNITGMVGAPSTHQVVDANGVKAPLQFKNQADAMENVHNNTVQMQQDISSLQEAVFKILQNQEMIINMNHKITYQADFLIKDTGARVKEIMVERPTVMKHGKKPDPLVQTGTDRKFNWETVFTTGKAATSVPTWDKSNELDKLQLGLKTNIEAQKAASSNFYPISKQDTQAIPSLRSKRDGTWESYVKTINDGTEGALYHGIAVPESKIEEIKNGIKKPIITTDKPFIDGRLTE